MRIYINTVSSGTDDYGWWQNRIPPYEERLWKLSGRNYVLPGKEYFVALDRQDGKWVLYFQSAIGVDSGTNRRAVALLALEIGDFECASQSFARRLLMACLDPSDRFLEIVRRFWDISGEEKFFDGKGFFEAVSAIGIDEGEELENLEPPISRCVMRLNRLGNDISEKRRLSHEYVRRYAFDRSIWGVQFLFTQLGYSLVENAEPEDALPDIPAKWIVCGQFADEEECQVNSFWRQVLDYLIGILRRLMCGKCRETE